VSTHERALQKRVLVSSVELAEIVHSLRSRHQFMCVSTVSKTGMTTTRTAGRISAVVSPIQLARCASMRKAVFEEFADDLQASDGQLTARSVIAA
jgi:hypothetical protein